MQPMAMRLGVDHQRLQQFVSSSAWPVEPVRTVLAHKAVELINPVARVIDDTGLVKDGHASPRVARQYSGTLSKVGNVDDQGQYPRRGRPGALSIELAVVPAAQLG
jgi:SRSO17 transposase